VAPNIGADVERRFRGGGMELFQVALQKALIAIDTFALLFPCMQGNPQKHCSALFAARPGKVPSRHPETHLREMILKRTLR
jgi:hypothetical protein